MRTRRDTEPPTLVVAQLLPVGEQSDDGQKPLGKGGLLLEAEVVQPSLSLVGRELHCLEMQD